MTAIRPSHRDRTNAITTDAPVEVRRPCWLTWRIVVPVLALLFVVYPAVMSIPDHGPMPASIAMTSPLPVQQSVHESCPPADPCTAGAIEQALPRLPVPLFLLLALVVLLLAMRWQHHAPSVAHDWWWPPNRRRALLQVFQI